MMHKLKNILLLLVFLLPEICLVSCKVGEDDPAISFRSRDNRVKANWKLDRMENHYEFRTFQAGNNPVTTIITSSFDGYDMRVKTEVNGALVSDSAFGMSYLMKVKDRGQLLYENAFIQFGFSVKSNGEDTWYWLNTDKKKARLSVGSALQAPLAAGITKLPAGVVLNPGSLPTDFSIDQLKSKALKLSFDKTSNQATLNGGFQQVILSSRLTFSSK